MRTFVVCTEEYQGSFQPAGPLHLDLYFAEDEECLAEQLGYDSIQELDAANGDGCSGYVIRELLQQPDGSLAFADTYVIPIGWDGVE